MCVCVWLRENVEGRGQIASGTLERQMVINLAWAAWTSGQKPVVKCS